MNIKDFLIPGSRYLVKKNDSHNSKEVKELTVLNTTTLLDGKELVKVQFDLETTASLRIKWLPISDFVIDNGVSDGEYTIIGVLYQSEGARLLKVI